MPGLGVARISRLAISIVLIALGVTQTAPVEVNAAGESWFSSSWLLRKAITIDATKVSSGPHTDFPVLINLSSDASLAANDPQTNIVQVDVAGSGADAKAWEQALRTLGVQVRPWGRNRLRCAVPQI